MKKRKIILVDTENVGFSKICGAELLNEDDLILLFVTGLTDDSTYSNERLKDVKTRATIKKIHVINGHKNYLDFQLIGYLGMLIGREQKIETDFFIVSNDKGYFAAIDLLEKYWKAGSIQLVPSIISIFDENAGRVLYNIYQHGVKEVVTYKVAMILFYTSNIEEAKENIIERVSQNVFEKCEPVVVSFFNKKEERINKQPLNVIHSSL